MAQAGTAPAIDLSTPAQQRFRAEWDFEAITEADNAIDAKRILDAGIAACGAHLAKPGAVADVVTSEFGLSGSGGQAATGAALRALRRGAATSPTGTAWFRVPRTRSPAREPSRLRLPGQDPAGVPCCRPYR
jgi:hypothetical protein